MARRPATLTAAFVRTVSKPGVYGDGRGSHGLSLRVHRMKSGRLSRTWRQRLRVAGRLTTTGLGRYPEVSLAEARHKAIENARAIGQGVDPRGGGVPTFREAAEETIRLHAESWKAGSPLPRGMALDVEAVRHADPGQAGGPDHVGRRAGVSPAGMEREASRRAESPEPDPRGISLVRWTRLHLDESRGPRSGRAPEGQRQRHDAPSRAPAR